MIRSTAFFVMCLGVALGTGGCRKRQAAMEGSGIAVTNSYLESAVRDLCGDAQEVFCMASPGLCPGHFDMSPEQLNRLLKCAAFLRFDFQSGLDAKLNRLKVPVLAVKGRPGLCKPQTYLDICGEVLPFVETAASIEASAMRERLDGLAKRLEALSEEMKQAVREMKLEGAKVLVSRHQAGFVEWLGLEITGVFQSADAITPSDLDACLRVGREHEVRLVIANLQEGTQLPEKIARNLNARLVVFSNFPDTQTFERGAFEQLVRSNVKNLIE
jgi:zinc transport system substrate-binding protein